MVYPPEISKRIAVPAHAADREFDATGVSANFECGCVIRFGVSIDAAEGRVTAAGYKSNGCGYIIAAAEIAAATVADLPLLELKGDTAAAVQRALDDGLADVPAGRRDCIASVIQAATAAFAAHRARQVQEFRGEIALICTCFGVTEDAIREAVQDGKAASVREVGDATNAGTGCGSCQMLIREILDAASR